MQYFNFLNCNSDITSCCTSTEMSYIMGSVRNIYDNSNNSSYIIDMCSSI